MNEFVEVLWAVKPCGWSIGQSSA